MTGAPQEARLAVVVTPRSARDEVAGWRGEELWLRVTAPPDGGKANAAACVLIADELGVPKRAVTVARGTTSRHKLLRVAGASDADLASVFGAPPG